MHRFFDTPHRGAAMLGEAIERAELGQGAESFPGKQNATFEILDRRKFPFSPCRDQLFYLLLAQSIYDTES